MFLFPKSHFALLELFNTCSVFCVQVACLRSVEAHMREDDLIQVWMCASSYISLSVSICRRVRRNRCGESGERHQHEVSISEHLSA